jgi:signal transduction histidine kinase
MAQSDKDQTEQPGGVRQTRNRAKSARRITIGVKFVSFVILVALLTGAIVGYTLIETSRDSLRQQVLYNNQAQANLASDFASNYLGAIQSHIQVFAKRPDIQLAILNNTPQQVQTTLAQFVEIQTALDSSGIYSSDGIQMVSSLANALTIGQSFADREWFQQALTSGRPYLGIPIKSRSTGKPVVPYAVPILDSQGQIKGLLAASISLARLSDSIVNINFGSDSLASIIDVRDGGIIIADNDPQHLLMPVSKNSAAIERALAGQGGSLETIGSGGQMELAGIAPVSNLPWAILIITPGKSALAIVDSLTLKATLITLLFIIFGALVGIIFMLGITRPIRRLMQGAQEIGRGNLDYDLTATSRDEIGDLSRAFGQMSLELKNTMVSRDELAKEVTERQRVGEQLKQSMAELTRSNADLAQFAYVASHDLQEPLRMVSSYLQLIEQRYKDKLDADGLEFISFAVDGANRMQIMINDLLAFSRVGTRGKPFESTDCGVVLNQALSNLQIAIAESQAVITHDPLPIVTADNSQLIQLFQNLIANALKFRAQAVPLIHISAQAKDAEWLFSVRDNGIGIDPQYFGRLFIIFQRLHSKSEYPGTGIGLALCKRVVERHGGKIWVESMPGQGSIFYFTIPLKGGN